MVLILLLLPVLILLLLPLRIQLDMCHGQRRVMQLRAGVGKLQQAWLIEVAHTTQGREVSVISQAGRIRQLHPGPQQGQQAIAWLRRFRHCRSARRFLLAHVHPLQLDAQLMLHTASAASTALATGAVRACISSLPPHWLRMARLRVLPDFLNDRSRHGAYSCCGRAHCL